MIVRFSYPMGSQGWTLDVEMAAVPRVGDMVADADGGELQVRTVVWNPWKATNEEHDVYVVVR